MYNISEFFYVVIMRGEEAVAVVAAGRVIAAVAAVAAVAVFERARSTSLG